VCRRSFPCSTLQHVNGFRQAIARVGVYALAPQKAFDRVLGLRTGRTHELTEAEQLYYMLGSKNEAGIRRTRVCSSTRLILNRPSTLSDANILSS
jgi:hypothetical protein